MSFRLRPATEADADLLLAWRNDSATRAASHSGDAVDPDAHRAWLARSLADPGRRLWIACRGDEPVGTVRADEVDAGTPQAHTLLSWTVAPDQRGQGVGKAMVALAAARIPGLLRAEVKDGNDASARIAQAIGMVLEGSASGTLHYRLDSARLAG